MSSFWSMSKSRDIFCLFRFTLWCCHEWSHFCVTRSGWMLLTCVQTSDWCVTGAQTPVCRSLSGANSFVLLRFWRSTQSSFTPSFCSPRLSLLAPALAAPSWALAQGLRGAELTCGHGGGASSMGRTLSNLSAPDFHL